VGQTIAFRGLSRLVRPGKLDRRQKPIVCPTESPQGAKVCRGSPVGQTIAFVVCRALPSQESLTDDKNRSSVLPNRRKARRIAGVALWDRPSLSWSVAPCQASKDRQTTKTDRLSHRIAARREGLPGVVVHKHAGQGCISRPPSVGGAVLGRSPEAVASVHRRLGNAPAVAQRVPEAAEHFRAACQAAATRPRWASRSYPG
jgi:hypothetical protein